jgi:hypothetical protein
MAKTPEGKLTDSIRSAIRGRWSDAWVFKVAGGGYQTAGVPDLLVCLNGRLVGIEVKCRRPGESEEHARSRVTLRQQAYLEQISASGAITGVAISVEEALALVEKVA